MGYPCQPARYFDCAPRRTGGPPDGLNLKVMTSRIPTLRDGYWSVVLVRALPAALLALVITFTADHSPRLGLTAFGLFGVSTGLIVGLSALRTPGRWPESSPITAQGAVTVAAGAAALAVALASPSAEVGSLLVVVAVWAAASGILELYAGVRARGSHPAARDWIFVGAITVALAVLLFAVPAGFEQQYAGPDRVARTLNASVVAVGALGAYGAIIAVFLVIAALSLKWAPTAQPQDGTAS